uniref:Uncharacterized protein n=1 Tax=Anguilla anguilla TaxID=7936 RepID=A0A0E9UDQ9_ANGAN
MVAMTCISCMMSFRSSSASMNLGEQWKELHERMHVNMFISKNPQQLFKFKTFKMHSRDHRI